MCSIAEIFGERNTLQLYLKIEAALAQAQAELGLIPTSAAIEIKARATLDTIDIARLRTATETTGYAVAPLVRQLTDSCGESGRFVHWGATTQDVVNTALALQINESFRVFLGYMTRIVAALREQAERHSGTLIAARTFGGHALPITFSFKLAVWLSSILRHHERIARATASRMPGEFAGVAGTLASLGHAGLLVRQKLMGLLDLDEPLITWASMRDEIFERVSLLAGLTNTLAKIAQDVAELSSTEIGELAEPNSGDKDTSSTLPFKSNPIICAQICVAASRVGLASHGLLQAGRQHQERSGEGLLEIQIVAPAFVEAERCVTKAITLLQGLLAFPKRMRANLDHTQGIILAERFMMELAPHFGRLRAHDVVHEACQAAVEKHCDVTTVLTDMPEIASRVSPGALRALGDPEGYLGSSEALTAAVLERARRVK